MVFLEEMSEVILVATALKAGSALAHGVSALNAYDEIYEEELYKASYFNRLKEFLALNGDAFKAFVDFDGQSLKKKGVLSVKREGEGTDRSCSRAYNGMPLLY